MVLRYYSGASISETAAALGISNAAVTTSTHRALRALAPLKVLTVIHAADDAVMGVADDLGVKRPRPVVSGGAFVVVVTLLSAG